MARPSTFKQETADAICARLAKGESLRAICREAGMPSRYAIYDWVMKKPAFAAQYTQARELGLDEIAEEVFELADDGSNDWMERTGKDGATSWQVNGEALGRSRLRFDARRWYLSKLAPKRFGDKVAVEASGPDGGPIEMTDAAAAAKLASILALAQSRRERADSTPEDDVGDLV